MERADLSIILACYNEGQTFEKSVWQIVSVLKKIKKKWEIIFVEDKSTDDTRKTVEKLTRQIKTAKAIYHRANLGRGRSVADGIKAAKGAICGYLDVDLEISPNYIPIFTKEIEKGAEIAVGKRFYEGGIKSLARFLASKTYAFFVKILLKMPLADTEAGYKFFARPKILPVLSRVRDKGWFWDTEICARSYFTGLKISQVPVLFVKRDDKKSTVKLIPDTISYFKNLVVFRGKIAKFQR
jgi:dolichyl-phosphate beta-glucosyltransferase